MAIIKTKRLSDGSYVELMPDGSTRPSVGQGTDWARLEAMTDAEAEAAARSDPDNPPLTAESATQRVRLPQARVIRRALHLTQEEFAQRYHIPVATLRDWEQGRSEPDQAAKAYLRAIAGDPAAVRNALEVSGRGR